MASNSGWDKATPLGSDAVSAGDDQIRSMKSHMQAWWEEAHYGTDGSAGSAGVHKLGSARGYVFASASQLSNPTGDNGGKIGFVGNQVWIADASNSTWTLAFGSLSLASVNTWTALNNFSAGITTSGITSTQNIQTTQLTASSRVTAADLAVGGVFTGIVSGVTNLAAALVIDGDDFPPISMVNTGSALTSGDIIIVGVPRDDAVAFSQEDVVFSAGIDLSSASVIVTFHNVSASTVTYASGTTIRYIGFKTT